MPNTLRSGPGGLFTHPTGNPTRTPQTDPAGGSQGDGTPDPTSNDPFSVLAGATVRQILRAGNLRPVELLEIYFDHADEHTSASRSPDLAFAASNLPVRWNEVVYTPLAWRRGSRSSSADIATDSLRLALDDISKALAAKAVRTLLAGAKVRVVRVFAGSMNVAGAYQTIFLGKGKEPEFSEGRMSWEVVSYVNLFNRECPARRMHRQCNHMLGDDACGVDLTASPHTVTGTAAASSTDRKLTDATGLNQSDADHWDIGWVEMTSGPDIGVRRPVYKFSPSTDTVELRYPFPSTMANQTYKIVRGCKKTKEDCEGRYDNLVNYGGFAEVPRKPNLPVGGAGA